MKVSWKIILTLFILGCGDTKTKTTRVDSLIMEKTEKKEVLNPTLKYNSKKDKIDLDLILSDEHNGYLAQMIGNKLTICCYDLLDISNTILLDTVSYTHLTLPTILLV